MAGKRPGPIRLWVSGSAVSAMNESELRFAVGTPTWTSTNSWKANVAGEHVYVVCRDNFEEIRATCILLPSKKPPGASASRRACRG